MREAAYIVGMVSIINSKLQLITVWNLDYVLPARNSIALKICSECDLGTSIPILCRKEWTYLASAIAGEA
ncbi:hypothetical protein YC2023_091433 [Brassica napus]